MKQTATDTTVYVRDASGNVMSVYTKTAGGNLLQSETHLYGSSRLGMATQHMVPDFSIVLASIFGNATKCTFTRGEKIFELSNHLGNVLATISDRRIQVSAGGQNVDSYLADIVTANDYYPFGMNMPGRKYSSGNAYRYGFNGQEKSEDVVLHSTTAEYWEYDSRIGRRWNLDPIVKIWESPYAVLNDSPLGISDPLGLDGDKPGKRKQAKNLSNKQLVDAAKTAYKHIENLQAGGQTVMGDMSNLNTRRTELVSMASDYAKANKLNAEGELEFYHNLENYFRGFSEVLYGGGNQAFKNLGSDVLSNKSLSDSWVIKLAIYDIGLYNGKYGTFVALAINAAVSTASLGAGPPLAMRSVGSLRLASNARMLLNPSDGKNVALSVSENLENFAKSVKGETWKSWGSTNFVTNFSEVINNTSNKIHFNLTAADGSQINAWRAVSEGAKGFEYSRATSWELYQIYSNEAAQSRTIFYYNGSIVPNPFK